MRTLATLLSDTLFAYLLDPAVIALTVVLTLALISGFVAHIIEFVEKISPMGTPRPQNIENRESSTIEQ